MTTVELEDMKKMDGKDSAASMLPQNGRVPIPEGAKLPQFLYTLAATTVVFVCGSALGWTAAALPYLLESDSVLPVTRDEASWIGSLMAIGALLGALPTGALADLIGRKLLIIALAIPLAISWIMIYFTKTVSIVYVARLIAGVSFGSVCSVIPMYITEITDDSMRGALGMMFLLMEKSGVLGVAMVAALFSYETVTLFCIACSIVGLIVACFLVETPYYYLRKGQKDAAEECLIKLRGPNFNARKEIEYLENNLFNSNGPKISLKDALKTRESKYAIIIGAGGMFFHQCSGISILSFFVGTIIRDTNVIAPQTGNLITSTATVVSLLFGTMLVKKAGRKTLLQITIIVCGLCMVYLGYFFHVKSSEEPSSLMKAFSLASLCVYFISYTLGIGPIPWIMIHETLPPGVRAVVSGWITAFNWTLAFGIAKCFQPMLDLIGPAATFWVFSGMCVVGCLFFTFVTIETRGKTLVEIQRELAGKGYRKNSNNC